MYKPGDRIVLQNKITGELQRYTINSSIYTDKGFKYYLIEDSSGLESTLTEHEISTNSPKPLVNHP